MDSVNQLSNQINVDDIRQWFDGYISNIHIDKVMMEADIASKETKEFYSQVIAGDMDSLAKSSRNSSTKYFISKIVNDYFKELQKFKVVPQRLAFDFSEAKILVWAQIANDDEAAEDALILSEAEANAKYSDNGFFVSSTIVEENDRMKVPPHYQEIKINGQLSSAY